MEKTKFPEARVMGVLCQAEGRASTVELCRENVAKVRGFRQLGQTGGQDIRCDVSGLRRVGVLDCNDPAESAQVKPLI